MLNPSLPSPLASPHILDGSLFGSLYSNTLGHVRPRQATDEFYLLSVIIFFLEPIVLKGFFLFCFSSSFFGRTAPPAGS